MHITRKTAAPGNTVESISAWSSRLGNRSFWARRAQQSVAGVLALGMLPLSAAAAWGQDGPPPPPPDQQQDYDAQQGPPPSAYQALPPEQIYQLVAPIALYPDSLVAQVLAGATYPAQIASAEQFVQQGGNYPPDQLAQMANEQPWDPSVKSLVAFPQVLNDMNRNMSWTTQLGNAYFNQPQDVLGAVQTMRQRAYAAGSLRTTPQLSVAYQPGDIVIAPVSPAVVYVPYYNPWVVYGAPLPVYAGYSWGPPRGIAFGAGLAIGFGVGIAIGAFAHYGWGYHSWAPNWGSHTVVFNHNTYISRSNTVVNHGYYGRFDRNPQARAFNQGESARFGGGNRTTINNVNINRGGNTTINRGGNTFNRGGNTFNNGGNTVNRGGQSYNSGGNTLNRGGQTYNNGGNTFNRGGQPNGGTSNFNRGGAPAGTNQFNRGNAGAQPGAAHGNFNARPAQAQAQPQQQHSQPAHQSAPHGGGGGGGGGHENHGGGGGGHDGHH